MELILYDQARRALAEAHRIDEVKSVRDKAQAVAAYARQAKDTQLIEHATEIKVRAERRAGEMLAAMANSGERARPGNQPLAKPRTLRDLNISEDQSARWQKVASIPEKHFEAAVQMAKNTAGEVTTAFLLREAKATAQPRTPTPTKSSSQRKPGQLRRDTAAAYDPVTERQRNLANAQAERLMRTVAAMEGSCMGVEIIDFGMVLSALGPEDVQVWEQKILSIMRALRTILKKLKGKNR